MTKFNNDKAKSFAAHRWEAIEQILGDQTLTPVQRNIAIALVKRMNRDKGYAYPSAKTLSEWIGVSERTVWRAIEAFGDHYFAVDGKSGKSNRYRLKPIAVIKQSRPQGDDARDNESQCHMSHLPDWYVTAASKGLTPPSDNNYKDYTKEDRLRQINLWLDQSDLAPRLKEAGAGQLSGDDINALKAKFEADVCMIPDIPPTGTKLRALFGLFIEHRLRKNN